MMKGIALALVLLFAGSLANTAHSAATAPKTQKHRAVTAMRPKLSLDSAQAIASAKVPGGRVKSHELEREKGHLIYSFDFVVPGKSGIQEVNVDAMTGAVLAIEHENPKAERRETIKEKNEAATPTPHH